MPRPPAQTAPKSRPIALSAAEVRAVLAVGKVQVRRVVSPETSTVLGYAGRSFWPNLLFDHAVLRDRASIMVAVCGPDKAPPDLHLSVPFRHHDDPPAPVEDLPWYRVRPKWEPGDSLWVRESFDAVEDPGCPKGEVRRKYRDEDGDTHYIAVDYAATPPNRIMDRLPKGHVNARRWKSPACMPRWASRLTLAVESVRVEPSPWTWVLELRRVV